MTAFTSKLLLENVVHGVPSGTYQGNDGPFESLPVIAADYYGGQGWAQTVTFALNNFRGRMIFRASLSGTPAVEGEFDRFYVTTRGGPKAWFDTYIYDTEGEVVSGMFSQNIIGNFAWIRVDVEEFFEGTITNVGVSY